MSNSLLRAVTLLGFIACFASGARAQTCTNANFSGTYFYLQQGAYMISGVKTPYAAVGTVNADGNGNVNGSGTEHNGLNTVDKISFSGTYSVNPNCGGTETLNVTPQDGSSHVETSAFQIMEGAREGVGLSTGTGDVVTSVVYRARTTCNTGSLRGTYGGSATGFTFTPGDLASVIGSVTFDGNGTVTASSGGGNDLTNGPTPLNGTGTYTVASNCTGNVSVGGVGGESEAIELAEGGHVLVLLEGGTTAIPAVGVLEPVSADSAIPHIAVNGGWNTEMIFVNSNNVPVNAQVNFIAGDGTPWDIPVLPPGVTKAETVNTVAISIPANARTVVQTAGNPATVVVGGWAQVVTPLPITAFAEFGQPLNGQASNGLTEAVAYSCGGSTSETVPFDNTNGQYFGVALVNPANIPATVTVTVFDPSGTQQQQTNLSTMLPAGGHTQFLLSDVIPATSGTGGTVPTGTVMLTSSVGNLDVTPLQFNSNGSFTSIPVPCQ
jgi:hypothetical protein